MSEIEDSVENGDNSSYTVQKFYEKNKEDQSKHKLASDDADSEKLKSSGEIPE